MRLWALIVLIFGAVSMPALAGDLDAKFLIKREGNVIGYHTVDVTETEDGYLVDTKIRMRVKLGPIPLFKYDHEAREVWKDGELASLTSVTNHNGERSSVEAERIDGVLMIDGTDFQGAAPAEAAPSSYWRKSIVDSPALINTQTGEIIAVEVESFGETTAPGDTLAEHYRITGTVSLDIWYDGEKWIGSHFIVDGEELTYLPADAEPNKKYAALDNRRGVSAGGR